MEYHIPEDVYEQGGTYEDKRRETNIPPGDREGQDGDELDIENASPKEIAKPRGAPGRPKSGGYSLEETMRNNHGWSKAKYDSIMVSSLLVCPTWWFTRI
jgi:hypothetical protein